MKIDLNKRIEWIKARVNLDDYTESLIRFQMQEAILEIVVPKLKNLLVTDVSGSACLHEPQYQNYNSETKLQICDKCGEITN
jgi:hypothetical protein